jgi:hypothetical protein
MALSKGTSLAVIDRPQRPVGLDWATASDVAATTINKDIRARSNMHPPESIDRSTYNCHMDKDFEVVVAGACRTPIGAFGGAFKDLGAVDLGAIVIREAIARPA